MNIKQLIKTHLCNLSQKNQIPIINTIQPKNAVTMKIKMSYKPLLASQKEIQLPHPQFSTPKVIKSQTFIQIGSKSSANSKTTTTCSKITSAYKPLHRSQFSMRTQSENSDTPSTIAECIQQIREIQKHSCVNLYHMAQETPDKMKSISDIINEMLPTCSQNAKVQNQTKIAQLTKQIIDEKAQKTKAIKSGQSLRMQQAEQIQQLKQRISLYQ